MIDFNRSFITWTIEWAEPDPVYAYPGGFVGEPGEATTSRVQIDAGCEIVDEARGTACTIYLTAPCRSEFIIADDNLFQVPNGEFRAAVSDACMVPIAAEPSWRDEGTRRQPIAARGSRSTTSTCAPMKHSPWRRPTPSWQLRWRAHASTPGPPTEITCRASR